MTLPKSKDRASVFVGSTFRDLKDYRRAVSNSLAGVAAVVRGMEHFGSRPGKPVDECLAVVRSCQIYIGIFGMRYGSIPRGHNKSMTHLEYEEAQRSGLPALIYILDEQQQPILPTHVETGQGAEALRRLKEDLCARHVVSTFTTPDDLARRVFEDVVKLLARLALVNDESTETPWSNASVDPATDTPFHDEPSVAHCTAEVLQSLPLVTFPKELTQLARSVRGDFWASLGTNRSLLTKLSTKLEPIVQIVPETPVPLVIGFEALAIGSRGENFHNLSQRLGNVDPGLFRLHLMLSAMRTASALWADAARRGNPGAKHLKFTINLDAQTLESPWLDEFLERYADLWERHIVFEIHERITTLYVPRLKRLQADFDIRYCADDVNRWNDDARSALADRVEMTKVDCSAFQRLMSARGENVEHTIEALSAHSLPGKPLVVEGIDDLSHMRFLRRHWSAARHGLLFGQGHAVEPGEPWQAWTRDLRDYGLPGGYILRGERARRQAPTPAHNKRFKFTLKK